MALASETKAKKRPRDSTKDGPRLVQSIEVARRLAISATSLKRWVAEGEFPEPHSIIHRTWFYRLDFIEAYIATGRWPDGVKFRRMRGGEG